MDETTIPEPQADRIAAKAQESLIVATLDITGPCRKHETTLRDLVLNCLNFAAAA